MTWRTLARVASLTRALPLMTRLTVCWETPATRATSQMLADRARGASWAGM
nr:hypothetical protein [Microbispora sp. GKU 823]